MRICWFIAFAVLPVFSQALQVQGVDHISLQEVAGKLGMKTSWVERDKVMQLESTWTKMVFEVDSRSFSLNGTSVYMGSPVVARKGRFYISSPDYDYNIKAILTPQLNSGVPRLNHIVLDAGHGGKDPGAENPAIKLKEKSLTLDLSRRVQSRLRTKGFTVSLTRDSDEFISLESRARKANQLNADFFVSLHFNASSKPGVSGVETYAFTPHMQPSTARSSLHSSDRKVYPGNSNDSWSTLAAYYVQRSLIQETKAPDRGLKRARFTVLRDITMPGILVEGGFVTNSTEGRNIGSSGYRDRLADAIVEGILVYQKTINRLSQ